MALGRGKESALLAILLLHANEPLSTDRLIEDLWRGATPGTASKTVQVYVSRLRKRLADNRLETTSAGYLLRVEQGELDIDLFEQLVGQGREELSRGEARAAEELFSQALALWRGPALAEFRFESFAQIEIRRLEELRAVVRCDGVDARLALGETENLVSELEELVAEVPLQERPRGQLMLALYRAGRQAEALEVYRQTRTLLADELGIEPGSELQALERSILNQDPAIDAPRTAHSIVVRRNGLLVLGGGLAVIAAAVVAAAIVTTHAGNARIAQLTPGSVGVINERTGDITAESALGGRPARIATGPRGVWVEGDEAGTLTSFDPSSRAVLRVFSTASFPSALAVGADAVWVLDGSSGVLTERDAAYGVVLHRVRVSQPNPVYDRDRTATLDPVSLAVGAGAAWTTDGSPTLTKVVASSGKIARIDLGKMLDGVAVGDSGVWAISGAAATVFHLSPGGTLTFPISIASRPGARSPYPIGVAVGAGFVWVLNANTGTVTKIDPTQRLVVDTIPIGIDHRPARIVAGDGAAWVADQDGTLIRIDAASDHHTLIPVGGSLRDLALARGSVWVTTAVGAHAARSVSGGAGRVRPLPTVSCTPIDSAPGTTPTLLIVGELSLQGPGSSAIAENAAAIRQVLAQHHYRAGRYVVGYQTCDHSEPNGDPSTAKCIANAHADAADPNVIGIIGPWSSTCTETELPILNRAPAGPIPTVGYGATDTGITRSGPGTSKREPARYYPTGLRNYVRVAAPNDTQGAADAIAAKRLGAKRVFILDDGPQGYGANMAASFIIAATHLGLTTLGPSVWNYSASSYQPFVDGIVRLHPDAVFLGTFLAPETVRLLQDIKTAMPHVQLIGPDGFSDVNQLIADAGDAAEGMTVSESGLPVDRLPVAGRTFAATVRAITGVSPDNFSMAAAQATEVLLDAIARSDGTRSSVVRQLFKTRVTNGLLGSFTFDHNGDTTADTVTIHRIVRARSTVYAVPTPPAALLRQRIPGG